MVNPPKSSASSLFLIAATSLVGISTTTASVAAFQSTRPVTLANRQARPSTRIAVSNLERELVNLDSPLAVPAGSDVAMDEVAAIESSQLQWRTSSFLASLSEKIGTIDESRYVFPEYSSNEVSRLFTAIDYQEQTPDGVTSQVTPADQDQLQKIVSIVHTAGSVVGAAALIAGTTVGAGILALPTATAAAGFLPSSAAMTAAWAYMTMSGLLIAELCLNRIFQQGKPDTGLLDLYESSLGKPWSAVGSAAYFFLHYAMMVAYISQGGTNLQVALSSGLDLSMLPAGTGQLVFALACGGALFAAKPTMVEKVNNWLVLGVFCSFLGILGIGAGTADFGALIDPVNQHPELVVNCFPILFLSLVYQNVVPTVVTQLEGDRNKIFQAIVAGTTVPFLMFLAWNAVILGNVVGLPTEDLNPVALLQSGSVAGATTLGPLVSAFSTLAVVTSVIGFTYGLVEAWRNVLKVDTVGPEFEKYKAALFALVFVPPLALSVANPDIFYQALENGGAFGVSTLFLILPPLMVWNERYGDEQKPLVAKPMVPLGKIPLASMWKAALTLIVEQGAEKLGVFDYFQEHILPGLSQQLAQWS